MIPHQLIFPFVPPSELLPNAKRRNHWSVTARATQSIRTLSRSEAIRQWADQKPLDGELVAEVRIVWPKGRRSCDMDAIAGLTKPVLDALQDIVYHDDKQIARVTYESTRGTSVSEPYYPDGCTCVTIWRKS